MLDLIVNPEDRFSHDATQFIITQANAEANRNAGKGKRHNLNMVMGRKPVVEYTRKDSQETSKISLLIMFLLSL